MKLTSLLIKLIAIILILNSCEENNGIIDEKITKNISGDNLRVIERLQQSTLSSGGSSSYKTNYFYNDEKMIEVKEYYEDQYEGWELNYRSGIEYQGNKIIISEYYGDDVDPFRKVEFIVDNDKILEALLYTNDYGELKLVSETVYSYSWSGDIIKAEYYSSYNGEWILRQMKELIYTNNLISEYMEYSYDFEGNVSLVDKEGFSYESDRLVEWIDYDYEYGSWENYLKIEYNYSGVLISDVSNFLFENNEWKYNQTYYYFYNDNGVLLEEEYESRKINYYYEVGEGNYSLLIADPLYERHSLPRTKKGSTTLTFFKIIENNHFK
jgi:hypothetical protein